METVTETPGHGQSPLFRENCLACQAWFPLAKSASGGSMSHAMVTPHPTFTPCPNPFLQACMHPFTLSPTQSHAFIVSRTHSYALIHSLIRSCTHSCIHLLILSCTHSCIIKHSFTHELLHPFPPPSCRGDLFTEYIQLC